MSGAQSFISLPDGRRLCWAEYGDPAGRPLMFFHGGPGSRLPVVPRQEEIAAALGVRLLCPERPGFGESTRQPSRPMRLISGRSRIALSRSGKPANSWRMSLSGCWCGSARVR